MEPEISNLQHRQYSTRCLAFLISDSPPRDTLYSHDPTGRRDSKMYRSSSNYPSANVCMENPVLYACLISRCLCRSGLVDQDRETFSCRVLRRVTGDIFLQETSLLPLRCDMIRCLEHEDRDICSKLSHHSSIKKDAHDVQNHGFYVLIRALQYQVSL
jgi:hypothetical protein